MNGKNGIVKLFPDLIGTIEMLTDEEAGRLLKALLRHVNGEDLPCMDREGLVFSMLRTQIDRDCADYGAYIEKQRQNGMKGGRPKASAGSPAASDENPAVIDENQKNPAVIDENPKNLELDIELDNDFDIEHDTDIEHEGESGARARVWQPPTEEQVAAYCREQGYALNAGVFVAHYGASRWQVNGHPIGNWKAKAREWALRDRAGGAPVSRAEKRVKGLDYPQRQYTEAELNAHMTDLSQFETG